MFADVQVARSTTTASWRTPKGTFEYNINLDAHGEHPNQALGQVSDAVKAAVLPVHVRHEDYLAPKCRTTCSRPTSAWRASKCTSTTGSATKSASYLAGLPIVAPASFVACWYTMFQFRAEWSGPWWENMPWRHVKSWEVT